MKSSKRACFEGEIYAQTSQGMVHIVSFDGDYLIRDLIIPITRLAVKRKIARSFPSVVRPEPPKLLEGEH
jgi:hypothetical protein